MFVQSGCFAIFSATFQALVTFTNTCVTMDLDFVGLQCLLPGVGPGTLVALESERDSASGIILSGTYVSAYFVPGA